MRRFLLLLLIAQPLSAIDFHDPRALVARAIERDPALRRLRADVSAARERIAPADALPNPMLMAGLQDKQDDLRDDEMMTMYMVGVSQRLVRPEKREALRAIAELESRALEGELDSVRAELERDVLLAWYEVAAVDARLHTAAEVRGVLESAVAAARVRYEVGTTMQADVVRAQMTARELEGEMLGLRGARRAALARLLPLLELPLETEVPALEFPISTEAEDIHARLVAPDDHPALLAAQSEVARAEAELRLAAAGRRPDLELEAQYGHRRLERDVFSLTARVELPLRARTTIEPRVREALLRRDAAKARVEELRRSLTLAMAAAYVAHEDATRQLEFHRDVLVPQSELAHQSTLAAYEIGRTSFDAVLATSADSLRIHLAYYELLARHAQSIVEFEAIRKGARGVAMSGASAVSGSRMNAPRGGSMTTAAPSTGMGGMQP